MMVQDAGAKPCKGNHIRTSALRHPTASSSLKLFIEFLFAVRLLGLNLLVFASESAGRILASKYFFDKRSLPILVR
jgi:hypothetical protein